MKVAPERSRSTPPSPRSASQIRKLLACGWNRQVGWNWMNSMFAIDGAGPVRHRDAVAGRDVRVGGVEVDLPAPPVASSVTGARECRDGARIECIEGVEPDAATEPGAHPLGDQVDPDRLLEEANPPALFVAGGQQGPFHLAPRQVLGMNDAATGVPSFPCQVELVPRPAGGKLNAQFHQLADPRRPLPDTEFDGFAATESGPGFQGVLNVRFKAVVRGENGGNPSLGIVGGPLPALALRQHRDAPMAGELEREREARDPSTDDHRIERFRHRIL